MSLALRRTLYFKYALTASYRISPVPTSAKEVEHIHQSFSKIAPIEYFSMENASAAEQNTYRQNLTIVFNSWDNLSLLNQHNAVSHQGELSAAHLEQRREELRAYLLSILGLPRFSFIEDDEVFMAGKTEIRFSHTAKGSDLGAYTISPSTAEKPFFTLKSEQPASKIISSLRHNFQKIHKLMPLSVRNGIPKHLKPSHSPDLAVDVPAINLSALSDLNQDVGVEEPQRISRNFTGFNL